MKRFLINLAAALALLIFWSLVFYSVARDQLGLPVDEAKRLSAMSGIIAVLLAFYALGYLRRLFNGDES